MGNITYTIKTNGEYEFVEKKSRFISYAYFVDSVDLTENYLKDLRKKYYDARHICYAYVLNSPVVEKCSDDGEPSGTAGKPLLDILKKRKLTNVLVVVIRYFGGIKLGAGGLLRAYNAGGAGALDNAEIKELKTYSIYQTKTVINDYSRVLNEFKLNSIEVLETDFSNPLEVKFKLAIEECEKEKLGKFKAFNIDFEYVENIER